MKTWWLVVKHVDQSIVANIRCECDDCRGKRGGFYPPEGFGILAYDDEERAKLYAVNSTTAHDQYEAIPVVRKST